MPGNAVFKAIFVLIAIPFLLTGCASTGSSNFSCSGMPSGVNCAPASKLYNLVDKPGYEDGVTGQMMDAQRRGNASVSADQRSDRRGDLSRRGSSLPDDSGEMRTEQGAPSFFGREPIIPAGDPDQLFLLNPPVADPTDPIRVQAVQQRVWVAPWVNQRGVWHGQQVIYVEVSGREWQNGVVGSGPAVPIFRPLER